MVAALSAQIEAYIKKSLICICYSKKRTFNFFCNAKLTVEKSYRVDFFCYKTKTYLIISDYYSKYPEISLVENQSTSNITTKLYSIFSRNGILVKVRSDKGPEFQNIDGS